MKKRLFISHSSDTNKHLITVIRMLLRDLTEDITLVDIKEYPGTEFASEIQRLIYSSDIVLAVIDSLDPKVYYELGIAIGAGKDVIVAAAQHTPIPFSIQSLPYAKLTGDYIADSLAIIKLINQTATRPQPLRAAPLSTSEELSTFISEPEHFATISHSRFEELIIAKIKKMGFRTHHPTDSRLGSFDFSIDLEEINGICLVETKILSRQGRASIDHVVQLTASAQIMKAAVALFIASSDFTSSALSFASKSEPPLKLVTLNQFIKLQTRKDLIDILLTRNAKVVLTGEKPGRGTYTCKNCGTRLSLDHKRDTLPPCPRCNRIEYLL